MNEKKVKDLVRQMKVYIEQLESEVFSDPQAYVTYNSHLHDEIKKYEQWDDDDGYPD